MPCRWVFSQGGSPLPRNPARARRINQRIVAADQDENRDRRANRRSAESRGCQQLAERIARPDRIFESIGHPRFEHLICAFRVVTGQLENRLFAFVVTASRQAKLQ